MRHYGESRCSRCRKFVYCVMQGTRPVCLDCRTGKTTDPTRKAER